MRMYHRLLLIIGLIGIPLSPLRANEIGPVQHVFECKLEYFVEISALKGKTTYFPYQTYKGQKLLLYLKEYKVGKESLKKGVFDIVSESGSVYWGSPDSLWQNPNYTDRYVDKWNWVANGTYYIDKFKFGRLTGLSTIPSDRRTNEGYGGQVSFWTAICRSVS